MVGYFAFSWSDWWELSWHVLILLAFGWFCGAEFVYAALKNGRTIMHQLFDLEEVKRAVAPLAIEFHAHCENEARLLAMLAHGDGPGVPDEHNLRADLAGTRKKIKKAKRNFWAAYGWLSAWKYDLPSRTAEYLPQRSR